MRKSFVAPVALAAALALTAPPAFAAPSAAPATAGTASSAQDTAVDARKAKAKKLKVKRSSKGYHRGTKGVTIRVSGAGKGKAKFFLGKKKRKTKKLKKGKAAWRMPKNLKPGKYTVRVKVGKRQGKTKVKVHNSQLKTNAVTFTVSMARPYDAAQVSGTVKWKGKWAGKGYVDFYRNGKVKGGSSSPNYVTMSTVSKGKFGPTSLASRVASKWGKGTYKIQGFYTPTASFAEYIHSAPITIVVTD